MQVAILILYYIIFVRYVFFNNRNTFLTGRIRFAEVTFACWWRRHEEPSTKWHGTSPYLLLFVWIVDFPLNNNNNNWKTKGQ